MRLMCVIVVLAQSFCIGHAIAQPAMFWFNDPVNPDETVLVTGAELDAISTVTVSRLPDESAPESEAEQRVPIIQANPFSLKFVVPKEFAPGIYRFTLSHGKGNISALLNVPTVYWTQGSLGEATSPGGWVQIFGRNIVRQRNRARLVLLPVGAGSPVTAILSDGGMWRGIFRIPDDTAAGVYQLRLANGDGGEWVDVARMQVRAPERGQLQTFDVSAYGAIGDGKANSTQAISAAIDAANRSGGGIVFIPRGRYLISEALLIPPGVTLKGEGTQLVNLVWPDFSEPPDALIKGTSRFAIEDVTIYASNHWHIISGGFSNGDISAPDASDITIRRVRIRASAYRGLMDPEATYRRMSEMNRRFPNSGPDTIRLSGDRLVVSDCDILGSGRSLYIVKGSNAVISGNILTNGRNGWYSITGSRQVIFENNLVSSADLQGAGGGINTISNSVTSSENIFMSRNAFKGFYGWDREALATDGPGGYYFGRAESEAANRLSLLDPANQFPVSQNWIGAGVMVVNGRGAGQFARLVAVENKSNSRPMTVDLDRPLQIGLDQTSRISVAQAQQNYLIVENQFQDAGVAAQTFGTGLNHIFADNTSTRTSGFYAIGLFYAHFAASWQMQFLNNRITEGNVYRAGPHREAFSEEAAVGVHAYQTENKPGAPPLARAIVIRGNRLEQDAHIEIKGFSAASPGVRDVVIEANTIGASRVGIRVDSGVASWLNRRNIVKQRLTK
jgi:hypothetical protein